MCGSGVAGTRPAHLGLQWVVPTLKTLRFGPLAGSLGLAVGVLAAVDVAGGFPNPWLGSVATATVLAGALLALDDPAVDLLATTPVGPVRRLLHRLVLIVTPVLVALAGLRFFSDRLDIALRLESTTLLALTCVGLSTYGVWWRRNARTAVSVGAAMQLGWIVWAAVTPAGQPLASIAHAVVLDPWLVVVGAAAAVAGAHARRRAPWAAPPGDVST